MDLPEGEKLEPPASPAVNDRVTGPATWTTSSGIPNLAAASSPL
jgi:hypothetical protein